MLDKVIHVRATIDSFSDAEFNVFEGRLHAMFGKRQLFVRSLFFLMAQQIKHGEYADVNRINAICKSITDLRRQQTEVVSPPVVSENFNTLPSSVISYAASFLQLRDLPCFMQCNRFIFISCFKPSTFRAAPDLIRFASNYGKVLFPAQLARFSARFRMAQRLRFYSPLSLFNFNYRWSWRSLERLNVSSALSDRATTQRLFHILRNTKIKELVLDGLVLPPNFTHQNFVDILSANSSTRFIDLHGIFWPDRIIFNDDFDDYAADLRRRLRSVRGFAISPQGGFGVCDATVAALSRRVRSLHITSFTELQLPRICADDALFTRLRELCIADVSWRLLGDIISHGGHRCRRIRCDFLDRGRLTPNTGGVEQSIVIGILLMDCHELQSLGLRVSVDDLNRMLESIVSMLELKRRVHRRHSVPGYVPCARHDGPQPKWDSLKIRIDVVGKVDRALAQLIQPHITNIVLLMRDMIEEDLLLTICSSATYEDSIHILGNSGGALEEFEVRITEDFRFGLSGTLIAITNEDNEMCGYGEKWRHSCSHCDSWI